MARGVLITGQMSEITAASIPSSNVRLRVRATVGFATKIRSHNLNGVIGAKLRLLFLRLQLRFIGCNKRTNFGCHIQQLEPLLFVEGHGETPHAVD